MEKIENIREIVKLACRLTDLCEGFDDCNKSIVMCTKFRVLLAIDDKQKISPSELKMKVAIAKSNLAILCKKLIESEEIEKIKDCFDSRCVFYKLTEKGKKWLNDALIKMGENFNRELGYKDNLECVDKTVAKLNELLG